MPTVEFTKELLLEEFSGETIDNNEELITKCVGIVVKQLMFREEVLNHYYHNGINITDKANAMRAISSYFGKNDMKKVYNIIVTFSKEIV